MKRQIMFLLRNVHHMISARKWQFTILFVSVSAPLHSNLVEISQAQSQQLRQSIYQAYSADMRQGGYYDSLQKGMNHSPKIVIHDCRKDVCLTSIEFDPGFDAPLYLVQLNPDRTFRFMRRVGIYGAAVRKAGFVQQGKITQIYVRSSTHMGTQARQLFAFRDGRTGALIAQRISAGKRTIMKSGSAMALKQALDQVGKLPPSVSF